MKKILLTIVCIILSACAQDSYKLKISNNLADAHGQGVYFRSSLRSGYASQIRRALSNKFGEMGIKTATATDNAEYIGIFDIETFYAQSGKNFNPDAINQASNQKVVLFSDEENAESLYYSGNANMNVSFDQTCFTLNIGRKGTSNVMYASTFCARGVIETEEFLPLVLDIYGKYATFKTANVGVQCQTSESGAVSCDIINDRQQAFINSLWIENKIND